MASTVNILSPNGRRFNLKVLPNDTIMQVLERVCSKGNFSPNDYDLKHQRSVLDVTVPFRYANIPNLAKLEMVKRSKPRGDSKVHIALQVESGERLGHDFNSDSSLLDILTHWEAQDSSLGLRDVKAVEAQTLQPVCIYMRREIIGEAWLKHTTLKSLGLTGGKAVIRHMHRVVDLPAPPAHHNKTETPSASQPKPSPSAPSTKDIPSTVALPTEDVPSPVALLPGDTPPLDLGATTSDQMKIEMSRSGGKGLDAGGPEKMDITSSSAKSELDVAQNGEKCEQSVDNDEQPMEVDVTGSCDLTDTGHSNFGNTAKPASGVATSRGGKEGKDGPSGARPKSSPARGTSGVGQSADVAMATGNEAPSVESFLQSHGTGGVDLDPRTRERIEQLMKKEEEMMRQMQEVAEQLKAEQMTAAIKPGVSAATSTTSQLQDFKFPDAPKKEAAKEKQGSSQSSTNLSEPCDRRVLVFSAGDMLPTGEEFQELPDSFFNVTAEDMKHLISDLKSQQASEKPLETKAMRDSRKQKQMSKYSKVTVRIHFPDHLIVQGFFKPKEKVSALYDFVQECVNGQTKGFYLYTTPPKNVLKNRSSTLYEAKLFPAAVVYFGSENLKAPYLSDDTLEKRVTLAEAEVTAFNDSQSEGVDEQSLEGSSQDVAGPSQSKRRPPSQPSTSQSAGSSKEGQVPKWFKMGKR